VRPQSHWRGRGPLQHPRCSLKWPGKKALGAMSLGGGDSIGSTKCGCVRIRSWTAAVREDAAQRALARTELGAPRAISSSLRRTRRLAFSKRCGASFPADDTP
jgi:hypothetical protein